MRGALASSQVLAPLRRLITLGNRTRWVDFLVGRGIYLVNLIASLVIYGYAAWRIYRGEMSVGQFLAVIDYVALMHKKFNWMLRIYLDWFSRRVSLDQGKRRCWTPRRSLPEDGPFRLWKRWRSSM